MPDRAEREKQEDLDKVRGTAIWDEAVDWMRGSSPILLKDVRMRHAENPKLWWAPFHFSTGMWVRNQLRKAGYGEKEMGVTNMDNVYVEIMEEAAGV